MYGKSKVSDIPQDHRMYIRLQRDRRKKIKFGKREFEKRISQRKK